MSKFQSSLEKIALGENMDSTLKIEERKRAEDKRGIDEIKNSFVRETVLEFRRKEEERMNEEKVKKMVEEMISLIVRYEKEGRKKYDEFFTERMESLLHDIRNTPFKSLAGIVKRCDMKGKREDLGKIFELDSICYAWQEKINQGDKNMEEKGSALKAEKRKVQPLRYDMRKKGWELIENKEETQLFSHHQLELAPVLPKGNRYIKGSELTMRAKSMQMAFGQRQAEYLLEHQDKMPQEWRKYHLIFPKTVWRDLGGFRNIPSLCWGGCWYMSFRWFDGGFYSYDRIIHFKNK